MLYFDLLPKKKDTVAVKTPFLKLRDANHRHTEGLKENIMDAFDIGEQ